MDKEMIHIDDLIRQKLGGREEEEKAGSWANMRSLLDKEMPVNPVASTNWRKYASLIAALLLVSGVTVGGYKAIESGYISMPGTHANGGNSNIASNKESNQNNNRNTNTVAATTTAASSSVVSTGGSAHEQTNNAENNNINQTLKTNNTNTVAAQPTTNKGVNTVNQTNQHNNQKTNNNSPTITSSSSSLTGSMASAAHKQNIGDEKHTDIIANHANTNALPGPLNTSTKTGNAADANGTAKSTAIAAGSGTNTTTKELTKNGTLGATANPGSHTNTVTPGNTIATNNNVGANVNNGSDGSSANKDAAPGKIQGTPTSNNTPDHLAVRKDTIELINLISRTVTNPYTGKKKVFIDTEAIEKKLVDRPIPAPYIIAVKNTKTQNTVAEIVPASAASMATADGAGKLVPLADHRVSSRKTGWDPQRFEEMFMQVKYNLGKVKFYPGIAGGISSSFINGFMPGVHLGLSGNVVFNDNWSVMTELKFSNSFNNRTQISDNYSKTQFELDDTSHHRIYVRDSFDHYFNFSTLGNVSLPIMLRYSYRQFFVSAGVNLIYNLGVNVEELNSPRRIYDTLSLSAPQPVDVGSKITSNDFKSRFGVGYVFGVGYQFTPAFSLDLRMTQTMWDNMSSAGAQNVSKQLFFKPAAQLSIGYRFGQRQH